VAAGRNASQNEIIVKKHARPDDMLFHAEIQGAAFVLLKTEGKAISPAAAKEASEFAAANSRAWSAGLGSVNVYSFRPEQASKSPPTGMSVSKGSFVVTGKRIWFRDVEIKLSVGFRMDRSTGGAGVVAGPLFAVRKNSDYFVTVKPGSKKPQELASEVKNKVLIKARPHDKPGIEKISLDEIQMHLPSGTGDVVG